MLNNNFIENNYKYYQEHLSKLPDPDEIYEFTDNLFRFLFPIKNNLSLSDYNSIYVELQEKLERLISKVNINSKEITSEFFEKTPEIHDLLFEDANAILKSDPAATCIEEVILTYPGFYATSIYRLAHELQNKDIKLIPRLMSEHAHSKTGIDIHPSAKIGKSLAIDHGTGIVIGETAEIGNNVRLYQGVTLGSLSVEKSMYKTKRHPTIQNNVTIYAGSTILGGDTVIGHHSIIGGNVWLTESVLPYSTVYQTNEIKIRNKSIIV